MSNPNLIRSGVMAIEDAWIDYNGHFNMAYYTVLFDRAADQAFNAMGLGPDYVKRTNNSYFTLETHTTYLRELQQSDPVVVDLQILDVDHKRVHYVQHMKHATDGWTACLLEVMVCHVDMATHKTSSFPADILARITEAAAAHKSAPVPPQVGHKIGIPRKV